MSGINIDDVKRRLEEKQRRREAHQKLMADHPVEPGKCCEMCVVVGCEQTAKCVCKPVKFVWFIGAGIAGICKDCAKKLREDNNNAKIHPIDSPMQQEMRRGGRTRKRKRKSKRKKTRRKKTRRKRKRKRKRSRRR